MGIKKHRLLCSSILLLTLVFIGCQGLVNDISINSLDWKEDSCQFAENFALQYSKNGESRLLVFASKNRKDTVSKFYRGNKKLPENSSYVKVDSTLRFATLASNYVGFLDAIGMAHKIGWVDETDYINSLRVLKKIKAGDIIECGSGENLNYEMLLAEKPLIVTYEIEGSTNPLIEQSKKLGLNTINCTDFKEQHPLGRAEWLKVFAWLTGDLANGKKLFSEIEDHYLETKYFCSGLKNKPSVFSGNLFSGVWNVSGGHSFLGTFINDAGGNYLYAQDTEKLNYVFSFEDVYSKCKDADVWLNPNAYFKFKNLIAEDSRYSLFGSFREKRVYNNNKMTNQKGGNGIWEMGVVRPDIVLKDLAICLHPKLMAKETTIFYQSLE